MEKAPNWNGWDNAEALTVSARDLWRVFKVGSEEIEVLRGLSFEIGSGERVFLVGASGAGKTTLLYTLAGLEPPSSGEVMVGGVSLYRRPAGGRAEMRNKLMGFVFQNYFLLPELTALENVMLPAMIGGKARKEVAAGLLEQVGLAERMGHLPAELSGGEQQRVAIARALVNSPGILFADEPTGNLDSKTGEDVVELLLRVVEETRKTLIVVTHDQRLARRGDRTLTLVDGELA